MKIKLLISISLALILMLSISGTVLAAPAAQETTPIEGTVLSITPETDPTTGETTVLVEVLLADGVTTQTVRISDDDAAALGLVTIDPTTGEVTVVDTAIGGDVTIQPTQVIGDEGEGEEAEHPVAAFLSDFFGVESGAIMDAHEDGFGFGVIAQALWMADKMDDGTTFDAILDAKESGDYPTLTDEDGNTFTPQNWGQFRKEVLQGDKKANLGQVMSGHADSGDEDGGEDGEDGEDDGEEGEESLDATTLHGNGNGHGKGNHGKGKGKKH